MSFNVDFFYLFSVQTRLASQQGISFTEFTYQLLQAYDFYVLNQQEGCAIQIGGSDQWGNILAGIELINKLNNQRSDSVMKEKVEAFAVTTPLLTTPSGQKFGKSAGNAVALDEKVTSVFDFYQVRASILLRWRD
jgi:tyrosyl-tRNA synthetase